MLSVSGQEPEQSVLVEGLMVNDEFVQRGICLNGTVFGEFNGALGGTKGDPLVKAFNAVASGHTGWFGCADRTGRCRSVEGRQRESGGANDPGIFQLCINQPGHNAAAGASGRPNALNLNG